MASIVPGLQTKAQWLCNLPAQDPGELGLRMTAQVLFTPSFLKRDPLSEAEFSEVKEIVAKGFAALRRGKRWSYKIIAAETFLEPARSGGIGSGGGVRMGWARGQKETFIVEAMRILAEAKDRLRVCGRSDCGRLIYAVKRQKFCADCAKETQRDRVARWRKRHPERVRQWAKKQYRRRTGSQGEGRRPQGTSEPSAPSRGRERGALRRR